MTLFCLSSPPSTGQARKAKKYLVNPVNPWPRPLAQTWHAKIESHSSCLLNIKAVIAFYDHFAPGQAGLENIVFIIEFS
jgi:hypothetical protein